MARNLLHKTDLQPFLEWLTANHIAWRAGTGQYQVAQVLPNAERNIWEAVYARLDAPEHLTVTAGLEHTVRRFTKRKAKHVEP